MRSANTNDYDLSEPLDGVHIIRYYYNTTTQRPHTVKFRGWILQFVRVHPVLEVHRTCLI